MMFLLPAVASGTPTLNHIHHCDALTLLRALPAAAVDLAVYDFPYMGVKEDAWDNQWKTVADYLAWLQPILAETKRVLKPNGSFYGFASPQMSARVEIAVQEYFNVLNNIVWYKTTGNRNWAANKESVRSYLPNTERIIFAEHQDAQGFLREYRLRSGVSSNQAAMLFPSETGGETGCVRNWELGLNTPSREQYDLLKTLYTLPAYNDMIRPFNMDSRSQFMDVWNFAPVQAYPGKHPCEKPLDMMEHIVKVSSRPGGIVLDCFAGSGATLDAARRLGRKYIGCDMDAGYVRKARARLATPYMLSMFNLLPAKVEVEPAAKPEQMVFSL